MSDGEKICKGKCGLPLPLTSFHAHSSTKDGRRNECAKCTKERVDNWRKNNPDRVKANVAKHADKRRESAKRWREKNPEKVKAQRDRAKLRRQEQSNG